MPELWLQKTFPVVQLANTNLLQSQSCSCLKEGKLEDHSEDSMDIFKTKILDGYKERPDPLFMGAKYDNIFIVHDYVHYAEL